MFDNSYDKKEVRTAEDRQSEDQKAAYVAFLLLGGGAWYWIETNQHVIENFYFRHFEKIYLAGYSLILVVAMYLVYLLRKHTKKMSERAHLLSPLWDKEEGNIVVGQTEDKISLHLSDEDRCSHVQVLGVTGRGKTQSVVIPWTLRDLKRKKSVILIDGKGSSDVPSTIKEQIDGRNIKVIEFDLGRIDESAVINPLKIGSVQQITDRIFSSFEFEDSYYRSVQYDICRYLVELIRKSREDVSFKRLHDLLVDDNLLSSKIRELSEDSDLKKGLVNFLKEPLKERQRKTSGLVSQLAPFAQGELSSIVNGADDGKEVSLAHLLLFEKDPFVLLVSIPTLKYQQIGHQLGKLILQDLAWAIGERENAPDSEIVSVFLDEFSEFVYEGFISILNKARSAKVALHLCHQSTSDLSCVSKDIELGINSNTNIKCIMGLNDPLTADFYARHMGTLTTEKLTEQALDEKYFGDPERTGQLSIREVESYKIHPNQLKGFGKGVGAIHFPTNRGPVTEVINFKRFEKSEWEECL